MSRKYLVTFIMLILLSGAAFFLSITSFLSRIPFLEEVCLHSNCDDTGQMRPEMAQMLQREGFSLSLYANFKLSLEILTVLTFSVVGILIIAKRPKSFMAIYTFLVLVFLGTSFPLATLPLHQTDYLWPVQIHQLLAWLLFIPFFYLFPNGKLTPRWTIIPMIIWIVTEIPYALFPDSIFSTRTWPEWASSPIFFGVLISCIVAQIYRYKKTATTIEKQQIKWLLFGFILFVISIYLSAIVYILPQDTNNVLKISLFFVTTTLQAFALCFIPVSIAYAILKYKMWQIDWILSRTLLFSLLTFIVVGFHVLFVGGLGILLKSPGNIVISLISTGFIALLFQPLNSRLQRIVNRLIYGERDEPLSVLIRLADRLEGTLPINQVLPALLDTTLKALKLSFIEIKLKNGISHSIGQTNGDYLNFQLLHQGEEVGSLKFGYRAPNERFSKKDIKLLQHLAKQIGLAAHSVIINYELQKSREKLVSTREEERRRLRRDLHDGVGPSIAAQTIKVGVAKQLLYENPKAAGELLSSLEDDLAKALTDIRHIIYNLRPPSLDDLGLVGAVNEFILQLTRPQSSSDLNIQLEVPTPLPSLPAAVEVAAFRIIQEALTNVLRHSQATDCTVELLVKEKGLSVVIADNGLGIPTGAKKGVGLISMRERAGEIGGSCNIHSSENKGTRIETLLPNLEDAYGISEGINCG